MTAPLSPSDLAAADLAAHVKPCYDLNAMFPNCRVCQRKTHSILADVCSDCRRLARPVPKQVKKVSR